SKPSNVARLISGSLSAFGSTKFDFSARIVSSISAGARESTVVFASADALGSADGLGVCAKIADAIPARSTEATIVFNFIRRAQILCVSGAQGNIAPEMAAFEMNFVNRSVGTFARLRDRVTQRCNRQYPTTRCHGLSILPFRSGMKNLYLRQPRRILQSLDWFPGFVFSRITAGGENHRHRNARIEFNRHIFEPAFNRRDQ